MNLISKSYKKLLWEDILVTHSWFAGWEKYKFCIRACVIIFHCRICSCPFYQWKQNVWNINFFIDPQRAKYSHFFWWRVIHLQLSLMSFVSYLSCHKSKYKFSVWNCIIESCWYSYHHQVNWLLFVHRWKEMNWYLSLPELDWIFHINSPNGINRNKI